MTPSNQHIQDLLDDPDFREWTLRPTPTLNKQWDQWLSAHPEKVALVKAAKDLLLSMSLELPKLTAEEGEALWDGIESKIDDDRPGRHKVVPLRGSASTDRNRQPGNRKSMRFRRLLVAANIVLALAFLAFAGWYIQGYEPQPVEEVRKVQEPPVFQKVNPYGQRYSTRMPDGTKITLNAGSVLEYSKDYNRIERKVKLKGEAFFEVAEDAKRPFIIETSELATTALGTSFNVQAYPGEAHSVVLVTGKVKVEDLNNLHEPILLAPHEKLSYVEGLWEKSHSQDFEEIIWKDGILQFSDTPLSEVFVRVERWFDVQIEIEGQLNEELFNATFHNPSLDRVLKTLSYTNQLELVRKDKKMITLKYKKQ